MQQSLRAVQLHMALLAAVFAIALLPAASAARREHAQDAVAKFKSYLGVRLYVNMPDYIGSKKSDMPISSAKELNCDFENPARCSWRNYGGVSMNRWLVGEKTDERSWTKLYVNPKNTPRTGSHVIVSGQSPEHPGETVGLISAEVPSQMGSGQLKFKYWVVNNAYVKVSIITEPVFPEAAYDVLLEKRFQCKQTLLCRLFKCAMCDEGVMDIPHSDFPFRILFEAEIPTGSMSAIMLDNIQYRAVVKPTSGVDAEPATSEVTVPAAKTVEVESPTDDSHESDGEQIDEVQEVDELEAMASVEQTAPVKKQPTKPTGSACAVLHCNFQTGNKCNWLSNTELDGKGYFRITQKPIGASPNVMIKPSAHKAFLGAEISGGQTAILESLRMKATREPMKLHLMLRRGTYGSTVRVCFEGRTLGNTRQCQLVAGPSLTVAEWKNPKEVVVDVPARTEKVSLIVENKHYANSGKSAFGIDYIHLKNSHNMSLCA